MVRKMHILFNVPVHEFPRAEEHRRFVEKAALKHEKLRAQRLKDLQRRRSSIADAIKSYEALDAGAKLLSVNVRSSFVRLATPRPDRTDTADRNTSRSAQL